MAPAANLSSWSRSSVLRPEPQARRNTAATILTTLGAKVGAGTMQASTPHLTVSASISDAVAAPGERLSIAVDVAQA